MSPYRLPLPRLKKLLEILDDLGTVCTLFVIPNDSYERYSKKGEFADCLRMALSCGHELGQHGYTHGGNEYMSEFGCLLPIPFPSYKKQKERISMGIERFTDLTGTRPVGFRAPFYLHSNITLNVLSGLNFKYDSSKTVFKPAYSTGMRVRVMSNLKPYGIKGVLEIPVTGDYTLNLQKFGFLSSLKQALKDFELIRSHDGVFVLNNHPNHVDLEVLSSFLGRITKSISQETDFLRLCDVEDHTS